MASVFPAFISARAVAGGPCDIYLAGRTPCVAAHSTVRALYSSYDGPLYQVKKMSDGETRDILVLRPGGLADSRSQDAFCEADPSCVIWRIYDQSPHGNHLDVGPGGGAVHAADKPVNASRAKISLGAHKVYGAFFEGGMGYSNGNTSGVAVGDEPESIYMVVSGSHFNGKCCMDYGNAEPDRNSHGPGTMEAIYFGSGQGHLAHPGEGKAPWIMGDLEAGLWGSDVKASREEPIHHELVTAMLKGDRTGADGKGHWVIKGGDATAGRLKVYFDGARPNTTTATTKRWPNSTGDAPMKKQGAIILGTGGDNSNKDVGTFFEGCITSGFASDATDEAVQANIVAAGYAAPTASASAEAASLGVSVIGAAAEPASAQHAASVVEADADALHMLPADHDVVIDPAGISISGLSSGADFTVQFQVAYSSLLAGSGVFAGQPYHCAVTRFQGDPLVNGSDPVCDDCPAGKTLEFDHCKHAATVDLVDPTVLADYARRQSAAGTIDDVAHLRHARIFLYRGTEDTCYQRGSVDKVRQFFAAFVANASAQLHFNRTTPSARQHGQTARPGAAQLATTGA